MKTGSMKKNFVFQMIYQIVVYLVPLIVAPYLTRTLGSERLGTYSYINTFVVYAGLVANLGIATYGQRLIARNRDNDISLRKSFWSLYVLHFITVTIAIILYFFVAVFIVKSNNKMFLIQVFFVLATMFDVTWFFYGLENFKTVVIKNCIVKIIECLLIFLLVRTRTDIYKYAIIMSMSSMAGEIVLIPQAMKIVPPIRFSYKDFTEHFKPMLLLFSSTVAVTLYTVFDKSLIGAMGSTNDVAIYEYSAKIIEIPKQILNVIGMVILPRACNAFAVGKYDNQKKYMDISIFLTCFLGSSFAFGLVAVSDKFSLLYYGKEFIECGKVIAYMTPLILIILIGNIYRTEYIIPAKLDKQLTFCHITSSILNLIISFTMIPIIGIYGAIVGTMFAETFGLIYQMHYCKKLYPVKQLFKNLIPFIVIGVIMFLAVNLIDINLDNSLLSLMIEIIAGAVIYLALSSICIRYLFLDKWNLLLKFFSFPKILYKG